MYLNVVILNVVYVPIATVERSSGSFEDTQSVIRCNLVVIANLCGVFYNPI